MQQRDPSLPPGDRARRRSLFGGRNAPPSSSIGAGLTPSAAERAETVITAYQDMIQEQLDEGLRAIQHSANTLMHEIAAEVWRSAGGDKEAVASTILKELSRDQAIRALIAHADERFQALAVRTGRLEDTMNMLAESVRSAREQIARSVDSLADASPSVGLGQMRSELGEVTKQMALALQTLAERDRAIVETVHERIREHGQLITQETTRISEAMEAYVQQGVEAMGRLAGSAAGQVEAVATRDDEISERIQVTVDREMAGLAEQLQLLYDRMSIGSSSLHDELVFLSERIGVDTREATEAVNRTLESRVIGLARLVRSDSEALQRELVRSAEAHDARIATELDERLGPVTDRLTELSGSLEVEVTRGMQGIVDRLDAETEERTRVLDERVGEVAARLENKTEEQTRLLDARLDETVSAIDRNVVRLADAMDGQLDRLERAVGERAATAADQAIGGRFDDVLARLSETATVIDRAGADVRSTAERTSSQIALANDAMEARQTQLATELVESLDQRIASLARLVRADNETLAQQIVADQEASKLALRAMKELQASLPAEVIEMVERRFTSLAESFERSNEMLAARIDRMAETIGRRQNDDIQVVIDRMGDAMHALASLGKGEPGTDGERIELG